MQGRHILANYTEDTVVVYQAYTPTIGHWAAKNGKFLGAPGFSPTRMTWVKTNFLWMMYRSEWAQAKNQETILAIWLKRASFDKILQSSAMTSFIPEIHSNKKEFEEALSASPIRLQWDPDHLPTGEKEQRRAIQLGLKNLDSYLNGEDIVHIEDITEKVAEQRQLVKDGKFDELMTPSERAYRPDDESIAEHICLSVIEQQQAH